MRGHVGQPIPHDSATKHVTGEARYIDDIPTPPDTLHVQIGMSERAHARVVSLDLANVLAAPGVVAVLTAADIPGDNDVAPTPTHDDPIFAEKLVEYVGQSTLGTKHRLENVGKVPLHMIEVQSGSYLGEDDIVRFEDDYKRQ